MVGDKFNIAFRWHFKLVFLYARDATDATATKIDYYFPHLVSQSYCSRRFSISISSVGGDTQVNNNDEDFFNSDLVTRILSADVRHATAATRCIFSYRLYTLQTACLWSSLLISLAFIRRSGLVYKIRYCHTIYLVLSIDQIPTLKKKGWLSGLQLPNQRHFSVIIAFYLPMLVYMYRLSNWER